MGAEEDITEEDVGAEEATIGVVGEEKGVAPLYQYKIITPCNTVKSRLYEPPKHLLRLYSFMST